MAKPSDALLAETYKAEFERAVNALKNDDLALKYADDIVRLVRERLGHELDPHIAILGTHKGEDCLVCSIDYYEKWRGIEAPYKDEVLDLVTEFFQGDEKKVRLWYDTANPLLGGVSPQDLIDMGRYEKLLKIVKVLIEENERCQ